MDKKIVNSINESFKNTDYITKDILKITNIKVNLICTKNNITYYCKAYNKESYIKNKTLNKLINNEILISKIIGPNFNYLLKVLDVFGTKDFIFIIYEYSKYGNIENNINKIKDKYNLQASMLCMLKDVLSGLKELKDNNIVHLNLNIKNIYFFQNCFKIGGYHMCKVFTHNIMENNFYYIYKNIESNFETVAYEVYNNSFFCYKTPIYNIGCIVHKIIYDNYPHEVTVINNRLFSKIYPVSNNSEYNTKYTIFNFILKSCLSQSYKERISLELLTGEVLFSYNLISITLKNKAKEILFSNFDHYNYNSGSNIHPSLYDSSIDNLLSSIKKKSIINKSNNNLKYKKSIRVSKFIDLTTIKSLNKSRVSKYNNLLFNSIKLKSNTPGNYKYNKFKKTKLKVNSLPKIRTLISNKIN